MASRSSEKKQKDCIITIFFNYGGFEDTSRAAYYLVVFITALGIDNGSFIFENIKHDFSPAVSSLMSHQKPHPQI